MRTDFIEDQAELSGLCRMSIHFGLRKIPSRVSSPRMCFRLLSGSDAESDEDDDLDDAADIMEMEAGDRDVNISDEALKNQVTRVHM